MLNRMSIKKMLVLGLVLPVIVLIASVSAALIALGNANQGMDRLYVDRIEPLVLLRNVAGLPLYV